jgi:RND family efflux transporter MFP subunit
MGTHPDTSLFLAEFASRLLAEREVMARARVIVETMSELAPSLAIILYVIDDEENPEWRAKAVIGDARVSLARVPLETGVFGAIASGRRPLIYDSRDLPREEYAHLDVRRTIVSLAYVPLLAEEQLIGAIEVISFDLVLDQHSFAPLVEIAEYSTGAIASALSYEKERNGSLQSITRLAQLYDIEKVLNSILEMDELLPLVASKSAEILDVQAVNIWMIAGDDNLLLVSRRGTDPAIEAGATQGPRDGIAGEVSDTGEAVLIDLPGDQRLARRNGGVEGGAAFSLMAAPILDRESLVGVIEVLNPNDGQVFDEDDLSLLVALCETAGGALHNASLLQAERKVEILETLVEVSKEITSTLNLDRVLQAVVNHTQTIIAFERAAIALEQRGALELKAISGMPLINAADPEVRNLKDMLEWASISNEQTLVSQRGDVIDDPRPETRARFADYFAKTGMRSFFALPLIDDQGRLGLLAFESSDPDFLTPAHLEIIKVLAAQATVALRNASLYREVPFINVLEPLLHRKQRFLAMGKQRRWATMAGAAAVVLFFLCCPWPMRVSGEATVSSSHSAEVQSELDGVVKRVWVQEGQAVKKGQLLAELDDWNYRTELAEAQAKLEEASASMNQALAHNDGALAGSERVKADFWQAELARARERASRSKIRAPFDGIVTTPQVENSAGRRLSHGDTFAEIIETSEVTINVAVAESEASLVRKDQPAAIKLESFPIETLRGRVMVVSPRSQVQSDEQVFIARIIVPNPAGTIRPGMQGQGKIYVGLHPAGFVAFRGPALWLWNRLWSWFGW